MRKLDSFEIPAFISENGSWSRAKKFVRLVIQELHHHNILGMASSLSYASLLAVIPVFAILLGVVGLVREGMYTEMFIATLKNQVPAVAGMDNLVDAIRNIASDAKAILGLGLLIFLATGFFLFTTVVKDFNRIWKVKRSRSLLSRMSGFITAIIIVPILMVLSLYINLYVGRTVDTIETALTDTPVILEFPDEETSPGDDKSEAGRSEGREKESETNSLPRVPERLRYDSNNPDEVSKEVETYRSGRTAVKAALRITSLLLSIMVMSSLYLLLPNHKVKWWAALSGGAFAGFILEFGNYLFRLYAAMSSTILLKIYGTLLAIPLGLLWLWILWFIILLGAVVCYVSQNLKKLSEKKLLEDKGQDVDLFLGLMLTIEAAKRYRQGENDETLVSSVSRETGFSEGLVRETLKTLVTKGILVKTNLPEEEYFPAKGMEGISLDQIVLPLLGKAFNVSTKDSAGRAAQVAGILKQAEWALQSNLGTTTLADLTSEEDPAQNEKNS